MKLRYQVVVEVEADGRVPAAAVLEAVARGAAPRVLDLAPGLSGPQESHYPASVGKVRIASCYVVHDEAV